MPQFAIYKNPGANRELLFVVQIQATRFDRRIGRVVIPLIRCDQRAPPDHPLTPRLLVQDQTVYANPLEIVTVVALHLKDALGILNEADKDRIIRAIDEMISQA